MAGRSGMWCKWRIGGRDFRSSCHPSFKGLPAFLGRFSGRFPLVFVALCGLLLALIGLASDGATYGTGYLQARGIVDGSLHYPASFFLLKYISMLITFCSGIPGGMFAPSLAIGAGMGGWAEQFLPHTSPGRYAAGYGCLFLWRCPVTADGNHHRDGNM